MQRRHILLVVAWLLIILVPVNGHAVEPNDGMPGVAPALSQPVTLDSATDTDDIFSVWLNQGDIIYAQLSNPLGVSGSFDPLLLLLPPGASMWTDDVARSGSSAFPKAISYTAARSGTYSMVAHLSPYEVGGGSCTLSWTVLSPVYRFYNASRGTHFYTPSPEETSMVISRWSDVFTYEGPVYYTQPYRNTQPLHRFYNNRSASHFYTASADEASIVMARWSNVFTYEGTTYKVSPYGPPSAAVYRFYNNQNGSHFFTASAEERDVVRARWPRIYIYEGPVFYLNP